MRPSRVELSLTKLLAVTHQKDNMSYGMTLEQVLSQQLQLVTSPRICRRVPLNTFERFLVLFALDFPLPCALTNSFAQTRSGVFDRTTILLTGNVVCDLRFRFSGATHTRPHR